MLPSCVVTITNHCELSVYSYVIYSPGILIHLLLKVNEIIACIEY